MSDDPTHLTDEASAWRCRVAFHPDLPSNLQERVAWALDRFERLAANEADASPQAAQARIIMDGLKRRYSDRPLMVAPAEMDIRGETHNAFHIEKNRVELTGGHSATVFLKHGEAVEMPFDALVAHEFRHAVDDEILERQTRKESKLAKLEARKNALHEKDVPTDAKRHARTERLIRRIDQEMTEVKAHSRDKDCRKVERLAMEAERPFMPGGVTREAYSQAIAPDRWNTGHASQGGVPPHAGQPFMTVAEYHALDHIMHQKHPYRREGKRALRDVAEHHGLDPERSVSLTGDVGLRRAALVPLEPLRPGFSRRGRNVADLQLEIDTPLHEPDLLSKSEGMMEAVRQAAERTRLKEILRGLAPEGHPEMAPMAAREIQAPSLPAKLKTPPGLCGPGGER